VSAAVDSSPGSSSRPSTALSTGRGTDPTAACGSATISVDYVPYMVASLANLGWAFAEATVTSFEPAVFNTVDGTTPSGFMVKPAPGEVHSAAKIFTPVDVGCTTRVDVSPHVRRGGRYIFVLADAMDASGKTVRASQEAKFAWPVDDSGIVATPDGPESIEALTRLVATASPSPSS
jgi:hypothetical protein